MASVRARAGAGFDRCTLRSRQLSRVEGSVALREAGARVSCHFRPLDKREQHLAWSHAEVGQGRRCHAHSLLPQTAPSCPKVAPLVIPQDLDMAPLLWNSAEAPEESSLQHPRPSPVHMACGSLILCGCGWGFISPPARELLRGHHPRL